MIKGISQKLITSKFPFPFEVPNSTSYKNPMQHKTERGKEKRNWVREKEGGRGGRKERREKGKKERKIRRKERRKENRKERNKKGKEEEECGRKNFPQPFKDSSSWSEN